MKKIPLLIAALPLLVLASCGDSGKIQSVFDDCFDTIGSDFVEVGDDGDSATVTLLDDADSTEEDAADVACFFKKLGMSDALYSDINNTTAMMGRQTQSEDGFTYRWTYHPDNGLEMTIRTE